MLLYFCESAPISRKFGKGGMIWEEEGVQGGGISGGLRECIANDWLVCCSAVRYRLCEAARVVMG